MTFKYCANGLLFYVVLSVFVPSIHSVTLRGVTLVSEPFVIEDGNQWEGYCIDILNEIAIIAGFDYYFYATTDAIYGEINSNKTKITGILGEVWSNKADFAISDITVTEERKKFVDFTDPLMNYSISALIHKSNVGNMKTFNDIADQSRISYGSLIGGMVWKLFESSNDMVLKRMFALMASSGVSVNNSDDGIDKAKSGRYAFIGESAINEYIADNECELTFISDNRVEFRRQIAIAVPKGSQYLSVFNKAIKQLVENKRVEQLRDLYWKRNCLKDSSHKLVSISFYTIFGLLLAHEFLLQTY